MTDLDTLAGKGALSLLEFTRWSGVGRTKALEEVATGRLHAVKVGRRLLIPVASAFAWLAARPPARAVTAAASTRRGEPGRRSTH